MTTTSARASTPGSKAKAKTNSGSGSKTKANSGSSPKARGGRPAGGKTSRQRVEDAVAGRIIELLDQGQLPPWEKDWRDSTNGTPRNAVSMKPYRGVNRWMTLLTHMAMGYQDPRWLTCRQAEALGGHVRRGERSTEIVFWKRVPVRDREDGQPGGNPVGEDGKPRTYPMLRSHRVFNKGAQPLPYPALQRRSLALNPPQFLHVHPQALRNHPISQLSQQPAEPPPARTTVIFGFPHCPHLSLTSPSPLPHLSLNWANWAF